MSVVAASRRTRLRRHAGRARRGVWAEPSFRAGTSLLGCLVLGSIVVSLVGPDPNAQDLAAGFSAPGSSGHLLGTDQLGRDVLAWCAAGIRTAIYVSAAVVALSWLIGTVIGLAAGYFGGWLDAVLMRLVDLQLAIPPILLFLAASIVLRPTMLTLILLLSVAGWVPYARVVRTKTQSERERPYVAAARLAGSGHGRILAVHLLPATASAVLVIASLQAGYVILWESGLSFLGLGIRPPQQSLGFLISQGKDLMTTAWWIVTIPGAIVVLLVVTFNLIGDGLRDRYGIDDRREL